MTSRRTTLGFAAGVLAGLVPAARALAQAAWPSRPVRIVVPYPAGGVNDVVARMFAEKLRRCWDRPWWWTTRPAPAAG